MKKPIFRILYLMALLAVNIMYFLDCWSAIGKERLFLFMNIDWLILNRLFLFILPIYTIIIGFYAKKLKSIDLSVFMVPPLIWFILIFVGGSGANILIVNPSLIGIISGLYLLRFILPIYREPKLIHILLLWILIMVVCIIASLALPVFPE